MLLIVFIAMSHESYQFDGDGMLQSTMLLCWSWLAQQLQATSRKQYLSDITDVHSSMENIQIAHNEKFDVIQTDMLKLKGSLKQTHKIAVSYCGML
jgi:hypothetical protein